MFPEVRVDPKHADTFQIRGFAWKTKSSLCMITDFACAFCSCPFWKTYLKSFVLQVAIFFAYAIPYTGLQQDFLTQWQCDKWQGFWSKKKKVNRFVWKCRSWPYLEMKITVGSDISTWCSCSSSSWQFLTNHMRRKRQDPMIYLTADEISEPMLHFPPSHRTQLKSDD